MKEINIANIKEKIKKLRKTGFFSIFLSNAFSKVIVFLGGILIVRVLSKTDYGTYAYILNCISILYLLNDFGASNAALQYMTESHDNKKKQKAILKFSIKIGLIASVISSFLILFSPFFYPFTLPKAKILTPFLFLIPLISTINYVIPVILRSNMENKKYAKLQIGTTIINYAMLIPLSLLFGLMGAIFSQYFYGVVVMLYGLFLIKEIYPKNKEKIKEQKKDNILDKKEKKQFFYFAVVTQLNNTLGGILLIADTFLIGLLIADPKIIALYKVSSAIPHALSFIPSCIIIYIIPYFIKHNNNAEWMRTNLKKLLLYSSILYGIICVILILGSKFIFNLMFGKEYLDAILPFIILMIGFFFSSTYKMSCSNIMYSMRKVKINFIINIVSVIINIILNVIFIKLFGYIGVAITTTIINIISSMLYYYYVNHFLKNKI